jgi:hypothetical protein
MIGGGHLMRGQVESGVVSGESEVQTEPKAISTDGRDKQTSHTELDERIGEHIRQEVERRFQSAKDKRWAQLEKQYGQLHELSDQSGSAFPDGGASQERISHEKTFQEKDGEGEVMWRAAMLLERVGLGNDPEAVSLMQRIAHSQDEEGYLEMMEDLVTLTLRRTGLEESPEAVVIQPSGGIAPAQNLQEAYEQRKKGLRPGDVNGLMALKREFREKGLDVF